MNNLKRTMALACVAAALLVQSAAADSIRGHYLAVRDAQSCSLAWKVTQGTYQGAQLDGLAIVAVVCGDGALGKGEKVKTRTTFLVDARATKSQRAALVAMAKSLAGETIQEVVGVKSVKIDVTVCQGCAAGHASLVAGTVKIRTRRLSDDDRVLDDENVKSDESKQADPTFAKLYYRYPAFTLEYSYSGRDFAGKPLRIDSKDLRTAAVGGFSL